MEYDKKPKVKTGFFSSPRRIFYVVLFGLIFGLTASALGLVSQQLHNNGSWNQNYPTLQYYHTLGVILFSCIFTLLFLLAHPRFALPIASFVAFAIAVFWGTAAGILWQVTPFGGRSCGNEEALANLPGRWGEVANQCSRIVALQAICWALWALFIVLFFGTLFHKFEIKPRQGVSFYGP